MASIVPLQETVVVKPSKKAAKRSHDEMKKEENHNPFLDFDRPETKDLWLRIMTPLTFPEFSECWKHCNENLCEGNGWLSIIETATKIKYKKGEEDKQIISTTGLVRVPDTVMFCDIEKEFGKCKIVNVEFKNSK